MAIALTALATVSSLTNGCASRSGEPAVDGRQGTAGRGNPCAEATSDTTPALRRDQLSTGMKRVASDAAGGATLVKGTRVGNEAFFLARRDDGHYVAGSLVRDQRSWESTGVMVGRPFVTGGGPLGTISPRPPNAGASDMSSFALVRGEHRKAIVGFVDPTLSRIETRRPDGTLTDVDRPSDGAALIVYDGRSDLIVYRTDTPVFLQSVDVIAPEPGEAATGSGGVDVATRFARLVTSAQWPRAVDFMGRGYPAAGSLATLACATNDSTLDPPTRTLRSGLFAFTLTDGHESDLLTVGVAKEAAKWEVFHYAFLAGSEGPTP